MWTWNIILRKPWILCFMVTLFFFLTIHSFTHNALYPVTAPISQTSQKMNELFVQSLGAQVKTRQCRLQYFYCIIIVCPLKGFARSPWLWWISFCRNTTNLARHVKQTCDCVLPWFGHRMSCCFHLLLCHWKRKGKRAEAPTFFKAVVHRAIMAICYMLETRCLLVSSQESQDSASLQEFRSCFLPNSSNFFLELTLFPIFSSQILLYLILILSPPHAHTHRSSRPSLIPSKHCRPTAPVLYNWTATDCPHAPLFSR